MEHVQQEESQLILVVLLEIHSYDFSMNGQFQEAYADADQVRVAKVDPELYMPILGCLVYCTTNDQVLDIFGLASALMSFCVAYNNRHITDQGITEVINGNKNKNVKVFECRGASLDNNASRVHPDIIY
ncbi:hypothetical protein BDA99DRAFT_533730 [Phascolomyces articulosus]|uniref:Uncharacterized protein n=1 Tax=Phascolomyces articulosus TaxID=60185 RepID=A0AAD5KIJ9_9FUNG|nr:hypothetical protein BDA99DRAFT_533730 [Phascolomyces articulosus]